MGQGPSIAGAGKRAVSLADKMCVGCGVGGRLTVHGRISDNDRAQKKNSDVMVTW